MKNMIFLQNRTEMTRVGEYVAHPNNGNGVWRSERLSYECSLPHLYKCAEAIVKLITEL